MATPGTQVQALTTDVDVAAIQANINATSKSFETKLGMFLGLLFASFEIEGPVGSGYDCWVPSQS